jgi:hypothetical protein
MCERHVHDDGGRGNDGGNDLVPVDSVLRRIRGLEHGGRLSSSAAPGRAPSRQGGDGRCTLPYYPPLRRRRRLLSLLPGVFSLSSSLGAEQQR